MADIRDVNGRVTHRRNCKEISTGFGTAGATLEDIALFKKHVGSNVKIKAAGGIKTRDDMIAFIQAGASRLGLFFI